jgi:Tol biopolymer transport system component
MKRSRFTRSWWAATLAVFVAALLALAACGGSETTASSPSSAAPTMAVPQAAITDYPATPLPTPTVAGTIVFSKALKTTTVYRSDLYIVNTDGSGLRRLTDAPATEEHPAWSPDGRKIAYAQYVGNGEDPNTANIWVMDADGSHKVRLTKGAVHGVWPAWSSDGKLIAFGSLSPSGDAVRVMNADGSGVKTVGKLSVYGGVGGEPPSSLGLGWTPDGRILTVKSGEVYAVNVDGSGLTPLTKDAQLGSFSVSPDGTKVTLESKGQLRIAPIQDDGPAVMITTLVNYLFPEPMTVPSWSPDGTHLAITGSTDPYSGLVGAPIYIFNADGSGFSAVPGVTAARDAAWRPE